MNEKTIRSRKGGQTNRDSRIVKGEKKRCREGGQVWLWGENVYGFIEKGKYKLGN